MSCYGPTVWKPLLSGLTFNCLIIKGLQESSGRLVFECAFNGFFYYLVAGLFAPRCRLSGDRGHAGVLSIFSQQPGGVKARFAHHQPPGALGEASHAKGLYVFRLACDRLLAGGCRRAVRCQLSSDKAHA